MAAINISHQWHNKTFESSVILLFYFLFIFLHLGSGVGHTFSKIRLTKKFTS